MKDFFKFMFASMLGFILTLIILFLIFIVIVFSAVSMSGSKDVVMIPAKSLLYLKFENPVPDRAPKSINPFDFSNFAFEKIMGLNDILRNIEKAKNDPNIKGIYLELSVIPSGISTIEEIRNKLLEFKESGKFIICYGEVFTQGAYYMATIADKIYMHPKGVMQFKGVNAELMFLKGTLEKLDIQVQIIRPAGNKYKSAVEPFFLEKMSDANREQIMAYVGDVWNHIVKGVSECRNLPVNEINAIADSLLVKNSEDALKYRFIDGLMYKDELQAELRNLLNLPENKKISLVKLSKYDGVILKDTKPKFTSNKIAVVYALGDIAGGEGDDNSIGSERLSEAIRQARKDSTVKAIVFRVNSPGGDALASDVIRREIELAKKVKPVVASYGDVAASGGYWISCNADKIIADETTLTGSIGVWGIIPNFQGLLNKKLGITMDNVQTNKNSGFPSVTRPMTDYESSIMQSYVDDTYSDFLNLVSGARSMTTDSVNAIGQGRIWSASDAKAIGLIDDFGGIEKAIKLAGEMAGITDYKLLSLPRQKDLFQQIIEGLTGRGESSIIKKELGENYRYYQLIRNVTHLDGIQARMPFEMTIN
ncbi:MAG: signal peptide peptidase SppA [Bacteroidetes bacterium]|nr:signal peptide peptidase SppA [Bacteroidota bacterium]